MSDFVVTADCGRWDEFDRDEFLRALPVLFAPGAAHELRALPGGSRLVHADRPDAAADTAAAMAVGARGLYYTLNPVDPAIGDHPAKNGDVTSRRWLYVDVDPVKAEPDGSATDDEKAATWALAAKLFEDLIALGWPEPVVIDSGNGYHLLYRIDLPNDDHSRRLVTGVIKSLARVYSSDGAKIDSGVHNAARIAKLPGGWARKGLHRPERPHRPCRLVYAPSPVLPVHTERLAELAGPAPKPANGHAASPFVVQAADGDRHAAYVRSAVVQELARVAMAPVGTRNEALNRAAFSIGTLLAAGNLDRKDVEEQLAFVAARAGLSEHETAQTIRSGLDAGAASPRELPREERKAAAAPGKNGRTDRPTEDDVAVTVCMADVEAVPVEWLWPSVIPLGKITLLAGLAKQGKSFFTMDLAARVSSGEPIPCGGGECFARGSVVLLSAEDDLHDTVKPRLVAAGADSRMVHALTTMRSPSGTLMPFDFSYIPQLEKVIMGLPDCRLLIIDPVTHYVGGKVDDHKVAQLRAALDPLKELAMRLRVAVLVVSHLNKGTGTKALHRVIGSSAYTALARANWLLMRDPENPKRRLLLDAGTNLAEDPPGLAYRIVNGRLEWEENPVHLTADDVLEAEAKARTEAASAGGGGKQVGRVDQAVEWLRGLFTAQAEIPSAAIFDQGKRKGFSRDVLFEAKKVLELRAVKIGNSWSWRFEPEEAPEPVGTNGRHDAPF